MRRLRCTYACESLERRRLLAAISWDAGGDGVHWNDPANWSGDLVPTANDDVTIGIGSVSVTDADASAKTLVTSAPLAVDHQTLTVDGDVTLGANASLQAVRLHINGNLTLANNSTLLLNQGYSNPASTIRFFGAVDRAILGNGTIDSQTDDNSSLILNDTQDGINHGLQLTIASGVSFTGMDAAIYSLKPGGSIVNNGSFDVVFWAFGNYGDDFASEGGFFNNGTISMAETVATNLVNNPGHTLNVTGGTVYFQGNWHNNGTLNLIDGSLVFESTFTRADVGTFNRTGGLVYIFGTLDNTGSTLALDATTGSWILQGTLLGGTYDSLGDNQIIPLGGVLDGVTVNSPITITGSSLRIWDGLTLNSTITMASDDVNDVHYATINFEGATDQTLGGTGSIVAQDSTIFTQIYNTTHSSDTQGQQVTIGSGITITSGGLQIAAFTPGASIVNNGTITSTGAADAWYLGSGGTTFINNGSITATGRMPVYFTNLQNSAGHTISVTGSMLYLDGDNWHNSGTLSIVDSDLYLGGNFALSDLGNYTRTGTGVTHVFGTLNNTAATLTLDAKLRDLYGDDGGYIKGGTIAAAGSQQFFGTGGVLDGVTLNLPASIPAGNILYIVDGLTLNNTTLTVGTAGNVSGSVLQFTGSGNQTVGGSGTIQIAGDATSVIYNYIDEASTLTIGSGIHIAGKNVLIHGVKLINNGSFDATVSEGNWGIGDLGFTNRGSFNVGGNVIAQISSFKNDTAGTVKVNENGVIVFHFDDSENDGVIDLNGAMIINYFDSDPIATVQSQIASGFNGGAWDGPGIRSSSAAASNGAGGLASGESSALLGPTGGTFAGVDVDGTAVLVRYTVSGDANQDGKVNSLDFTVLAAHFNQSAATGFADGDFNYDHKMNALDFNMLASHFGQTLPSTSLPAASASPRLFCDVSITDKSMVDVLSSA